MKILDSLNFFFYLVTFIAFISIANFFSPATEKYYYYAKNIITCVVMFEIKRNNNFAEIQRSFIGNMAIG